LIQEEPDVVRVEDSELESETARIANDPSIRGALMSSNEPKRPADQLVKDV